MGLYWHDHGLHLSADLEGGIALNIVAQAGWAVASPLMLVPEAQAFSSSGRIAWVGVFRVVLAEFSPSIFFC